MKIKGTNKIGSMDWFLRSFFVTFTVLEIVIILTGSVDVSHFSLKSGIVLLLSAAAIHTGMAFEAISVFPIDVGDCQTFETQRKRQCIIGCFAAASDLFCVFVFFNIAIHFKVSGMMTVILILAGLFAPPYISPILTSAIVRKWFLRR
jgi:hypothetical protein